MINKILKRIRKISQNFYSNKIESLLDLDIKELINGGWSIGQDDIDVLENELHRFMQYSGIKVLDIGSGTSTLVFLRYMLKNHKFSSLDTVEQDPFWFQKMKKVTDIHLLGVDKVTFNLIHCDYDDKTGFDFNILDSYLSNDYDIIFIDAPPDTSIVDGRYLLCVKIITRLKINGVLIIHDVYRNTELYAFERLKLLFRRSEIISTIKGIGVLSFLYR